MGKVSKPLGPNAQLPSYSDREWFVLMMLPVNLVTPPRAFVVPRDHVAGAAWIFYTNWLTDPSAQ